MTLVAYSARWLIDGIHDRPIENGVVVVNGSRIEGAGAIPVPATAKEVDLGNVTLMPGLIDCHVHLPFDGSTEPVDAFKRLSIASATLMALKHSQLLLRKGITTVRDVSTPNGIS